MTAAVPVIADHSVEIRLSDIGLFTKRKAHEHFSQRERAVQIQQQFAHCMRNALAGNGCIMPSLCANSQSLDEPLSCGHLYIGHGPPPFAYSGMLLIDLDNFTGNGIAMPIDRQQKILKRLRAIGTLVYRAETRCEDCALGAFPGDVHIPALARISAFPARRKPPAGAPRKRSQVPRARGKGGGGLLGRIFGLR